MANGRRSKATAIVAPSAAVISNPFPLLGIYPFQHWILYGDFGSGKSTMAASFVVAGPELVLMFDPYGKDIPYLKRGQPTELQECNGYMWRSVLGPQGEEIIRLEYFLEFDSSGSANMWDVFLKRLNKIKYGEYQQWSTIVIDSQNSTELTARYFGKRLNPAPKFDQRHWFGYSTDQLEQVLMCDVPSLPTNVVLICHSGEDKDEINGTFVRSLHARGRLGDKKGLATMYSEIYRCYVGKDEKGGKIRAVQTETDNFWSATTQINAPDPSWPEYAKLWENWK